MISLETLPSVVDTSRDSGDSYTDLIRDLFITYLIT